MTNILNKKKLKFAMKLLQSIIAIGLSIFFLLSTVHSHPHHGGSHSEPTVINDNHKHNHIYPATHECEDCLIKNNKSTVENTVEIIKESSTTIQKLKNESFEKYSLPIKLDSRPPPEPHL